MIGIITSLLLVNDCYLVDLFVVEMSTVHSCTFYGQ